MLRYAVAAMCGISLSGSVYMAGWGSSGRHGGSGQIYAAGDDCCTPASASELAGISAKIDAAGLQDVGNTKCIVMPEDPVSDKTFVHLGKVYHICCPACEEAFKKEPDKYLKALAADPAKFGVKTH